VNVTTVIIGAGHAGLAMSRQLTDRSIEHVILERGEVANSWRTERWNSLRLLTPNWQTRLPDMSYSGPDPHGFMSSGDLVGFIADYARHIAAPVMTQTTVTRVQRDDGMYRIETDQGVWHSRSLVMASGGCNIPNVPAVAQLVPPSIASVTPVHYAGPEQLDDRGVLIVGASATGVQLADEIHRSGRPVTLAVGEHVRLPRRYRGRDIFWWMENAGVLAQTTNEVDDVNRARRVPSPQLVGTDSHASIDLNTLQDLGVTIVGRLAHISNGRAQFSGSLRNVCALADLKMNRLLGTFDEWATSSGADREVDEVERFEPTRVPDPISLELDLTRGDIGTILWATGYRPDYSWLDIPLLDRKGRMRHDDGVVTASPGAYVLGLSYLRRRGSSFISGATQDTSELADHLARFLDQSGRA
jgi:putative flavoprotein involved in K+ transport